MGIVTRSQRNVPTMTETDYVIATNRAKISAALTILRDVLPTCDVDDFGITDKELKDLTKKLYEVELRMFSLTKID